jgi:predicted amidohydrolase YtcJ
MKYWIRLSMAALAVCAVPELARTAAPPADLILTNAHIKTSTGWAQAMAIREGVIVGLGKVQDIAPLGGTATKVMDLGGDTVLPGLHDVHVHPVFGGITARECVIPQGSSLQALQAIVKACALKAKPGEWVTGGQWDASALGKVPNKAQLDKVAAGIPVLLRDTSGHSVWGNSEALRLAGVGKATPDPKGGIIERDASGQPTGVLREVAADLAESHVPPRTEKDAEAALRWALHEMVSQGITSFTEAALGFTTGVQNEFEAYAALADAGVLKQRARVCMVWAPSDEGFEATLAERNLYTRDRVKFDCIKIFLDGVPTDSHTAAMLEPYAGIVPGRTDEASRYGLLQVKQEVLDAAVTRFDRLGLTVKFHAAGDAAVRAGLSAIAAARKTNGFSPQMHNVGHCTFVAKDDIARARSFGATFEVSPYLWGPTPINDDITAAVGPETIQRVWPVREMLDAGALVVPGSDWSVVPSVNPWIGIETLVTREKPGGSADSFGKAEAITVDEAFKLFTENSAKQEGVGSLVGRIEPGMLADLIVVDRNPFAIPVTDIHATQVRMTFIAGEKVYEAGK